MAPKKKQEKMALGDFLTNQSLGSWADEMDSQPLPAMSSGYGARDRGGDRGEQRSFTQPSWERATGGGGGGMDRGGSFGMADRPRYGDREQLPLPTKPPYTAHLGNLAYDVTQVDIESFLGGCEVTNVRLVEDKLDRKPKGFGYVEFGSLDGLKKALTLTESNFMGRNIKISVAEPPKDRAESSRDFSDWSRKGPLPELPQNGRQPSRGYNRGGFEPAPDAAGARKPGFFPADDGKVRDFGNWERKGPLSPVPGDGPPVRDGGRVREGGAGGPRERRQSPSWGDSDSGSRPPRKEFEPRPQVERAPTAAEQDTQWRARMRPDQSPAATPDVSTPTSPAPQAPKERPRLNLAKRTVSTAEPGTPNSATDSKASPFGAARPIDTAQREREVEEKRELAVRQKREAEEKAKEERAANAKDETAAAAAAGATTSPPAGPQRGVRRPSRQQNGAKSGAKENGDATPSSQTRANFSILSREAEDGDAAQVESAAGASDAVDASANGTIIGDKETKPQEVTREVGESQGAADTTAQALEDDGWSTVATKSKSKGRGGARALAS